MSKDVINVRGEDVVVREDTAKAYRGVNWAIISIGGFVLIVAILFVAFLIRATRNGPVPGPSGSLQNSENSAGQSR